jgi:hypothetical protein
MVKDAVFELYIRSLAPLPPRLRVAIEFLRVHGRLPDLENPRTFNEKILWRMLNDRDERLPDLVDKIRSKEILAQRYGADLVIPTLATFDRPEDMDFEREPLSRPPYVVKANHGWAMNLFVLDEGALRTDPGAERIRRKTRKWLATDHSKRLAEWAYSQVRRRILVEPYMGPMDDFKLHVFHGRTFACEVISNRFSEGRQEGLYDRSWAQMDVAYSTAGYRRRDGSLPSEEARARMIELAEDIGREFSYVRVDFYLPRGELKFGELTFYPGGGQERFYPASWDRVFGDQWRLDCDDGRTRSSQSTKGRPSLAQGECSERPESADPS